MPRSTRIHYPGALYHAMARGNNGERTFHDDTDRLSFLEMLTEIKIRSSFKLYSFCLMSNHFHLLLEVDQIPLSVIMQRVLTRYCKYFNIRYHRIGHLFQSRYKPILCQKDSYLLQLLRYIHLNPVRANMVENPSDWPWSSHIDYLGLRHHPLIDSQFPLSLFHPNPTQARNIYAQFSTNEAAPENPQQIITVIPTSPPLGKQMSPPDSHQKKSLIELGEAVFDKTGVQLDTIRSSSRSHPVVLARHLLINLAIDHGLKPSAIANFVNCSASCVSKLLVRQGR